MHAFVEDCFSCSLYEETLIIFIKKKKLFRALLCDVVVPWPNYPFKFKRIIALYVNEICNILATYVLTKNGRNCGPFSFWMSFRIWSHKHFVTCRTCEFEISVIVILQSEVSHFFIARLRRRPRSTGSWSSTTSSSRAPPSLSWTCPLERPSTITLPRTCSWLLEYSVNRAWPV